MPLTPTPAAFQNAQDIAQAVQIGAQLLAEAGVAFGHGTSNAQDEAAWLVLWRVGLPLDTELNEIPPDTVLPHDWRGLLGALFEQRIASRKPAAYLTQEAWLQGVPFYVDERSIVPRSFIAELLADGALDYWLSEHTHRVLDLCTGNGSLGVLAAMAYPDVQVDAADLSVPALEVAAINVAKHGLGERITLIQGDGIGACAPRVHTHGPYDLILCNPPYVNARSMAELPQEYQAEPAMALASGVDGMDFTRALLREAAHYMSANAVLVLEIGNERDHFERAFPNLAAVWLDTSAGEDQVLVLTRHALSPP